MHQLEKEKIEIERNLLEIEVTYYFIYTFIKILIIIYIILRNYSLLKRGIN